jgi:hypothetical protein
MDEKSPAQRTGLRRHKIWCTAFANAHCVGQRGLSVAESISYRSREEISSRATTPPPPGDTRTVPACP